MQIDSFKESGSIEFSADTLLGIQFSACQGQDGSPNREWNMIQEKDKNPREMDLVVLKQRYGETGRVPFLYYAAYDCFTEAGDRPTAAPLPRTEEAPPAQAAAPSQTAAPAPTASPLSQPPAAEQAEESPRFDAQWLTRICAIAAHECNETLERVMFDMTLSTVCCLFVNYAQRQSAEPHRFRRRPNEKLAAKISARIDQLSEEFLSDKSDQSNRSDNQ